MYCVCTKLKQSRTRGNLSVSFATSWFILFGEDLLEETGMKIIETNSVPLHRIGDVFRKGWLHKLYFDNTLKDAN